ncbi:hypothetical protein JKP88DRAFT_295227 [Tribonema minus]|uniref:Uncharacterized protein n=1 Tax=Tribonema minus TaxID=303371 RepID=A0A835ZDK1_9STRA|nr:hypothetical protein JKP88DRAFT_295227 [Tribonema minus]
MAARCRRRCSAPLAHQRRAAPQPTSASAAARRWLSNAGFARHCRYGCMATNTVGAAAAASSIDGSWRLSPPPLQLDDVGFVHMHIAVRCCLDTALPSCHQWRVRLAEDGCDNFGHILAMQAAIDAAHAAYKDSKHHLFAYDRLALYVLQDEGCYALLSVVDAVTDCPLYGSEGAYTLLSRRYQSGHTEGRIADVNHVKSAHSILWWQWSLHNLGLKPVSAESATAEERHLIFQHSFRRTEPYCGNCNDHITLANAHLEAPPMDLTFCPRRALLKEGRAELAHLHYSPWCRECVEKQQGGRGGTGWARAFDSRRRKHNVAMHACSQIRKNQHLHTAERNEAPHRAIPRPTITQQHLLVMPLLTGYMRDRIAAGDAPYAPANQLAVCLPCQYAAGAVHGFDRRLALGLVVTSLAMWGAEHPTLAGDAATAWDAGLADYAKSFAQAHKRWTAEEVEEMVRKAHGKCVTLGFRVLFGTHKQMLAQARRCPRACDVKVAQQARGPEARDKILERLKGHMDRVKPLQNITEDGRKRRVYEKDNVRLTCALANQGVTLLYAFGMRRVQVSFSLSPPSASGLAGLPHHDMASAPPPPTAAACMFCARPLVTAKGTRDAELADDQARRIWLMRDAVAYYSAIASRDCHTGKAAALQKTAADAAQRLYEEQLSDASTNQVPWVAGAALIKHDATTKLNDEVERLLQLHRAAVERLARGCLCFMLANTPHHSNEYCAGHVPGGAGIDAFMRAAFGGRARYNPSVPFFGHTYAERIVTGQHIPCPRYDVGDVCGDADGADTGDDEDDDDDDGFADSASDGSFSNDDDDGGLRKPAALAPSPNRVLTPRRSDSIGSSPLRSSSGGGGAHRHVAVRRNSAGGSGGSGSAANLRTASGGGDRGGAAAAAADAVARGAPNAQRAFAARPAFAAAAHGGPVRQILAPSDGAIEMPMSQLIARMQASGGASGGGSDGGSAGDVTGGTGAAAARGMGVSSGGAGASSSGVSGERGCGAPHAQRAPAARPAFNPYSKKPARSGGGGERMVVGAAGARGMGASSGGGGAYTGGGRGGAIGDGAPKASGGTSGASQVNPYKQPALSGGASAARGGCASSRPWIYREAPLVPPLALGAPPPPRSLPPAVLYAPPPPPPLPAPIPLAPAAPTTMRSPPPRAGPPSLRRMGASSGGGGAYTGGGRGGAIGDGAPKASGDTNGASQVNPYKQPALSGGAGAVRGGCGGGSSGGAARQGRLLVGIYREAPLMPPLALGAPPPPRSLPPAVLYAPPPPPPLPAPIPLAPAAPTTMRSPPSRAGPPSLRRRARRRCARCAWGAPQPRSPLTPLLDAPAPPLLTPIPLAAAAPVPPVTSPALPPSLPPPEAPPLACIRAINCDMGISIAPSEGARICRTGPPCAAAAKAGRAAKARCALGAPRATASAAAAAAPPLSPPPDVVRKRARRAAATAAAAAAAYGTAAWRRRRGQRRHERRLASTPLQAAGPAGRRGRGARRRRRRQQRRQQRRRMAQHRTHAWRLQGRHGRFRAASGAPHAQHAAHAPSAAAVRSILPAPRGATELSADDLLAQMSAARGGDSSGDSGGGHDVSAAARGGNERGSFVPASHLRRAPLHH